jgi:hypothetical protein
MTPGAPPASTPAERGTAPKILDEYLDRLVATLSGPPRGRLEVAVEIRDGLLEATEAHRSQGRDEQTSMRLAVAEFGDPVQLAVALTEELQARQARRTGSHLMASGPLIGLLWLATISGSGGAFWPPQLPGALVVLLAVPCLLIGVPCAAFAMVAGRRLTSGLLNDGLAPSAARLAALAAGGVDLLALVGLVAYVVVWHGELSPFVYAAVTASVVRLVICLMTGCRGMLQRVARLPVLPWEPR